MSLKVALILVVAAALATQAFRIDADAAEESRDAQPAGEGDGYLSKALGMLTNLLWRGNKGNKPGAHEAGSNWDFVVFTQSWPATVCMQWKGRGPGHTCSLPRKGMWTIHGLWPSKAGTTGPAFCKSTPRFDEELIRPILGKLKETWKNVNQPSAEDSFWEYEWKKHGTCASGHPVLEDQFNYFNQGLKWAEEFKIDTALLNGGIVNGEVQSAQGIWSAVFAHFHKKPTVHCFNTSGQSYLMEIRLCFNKNLTLIDCPPHAGGSTYLVGCPRDVMYPKLPTRS